MDLTREPVLFSDGYAIADRASEDQVKILQLIENTAVVLVKSLTADQAVQANSGRPDPTTKSSLTSSLPQLSLLSRRINNFFLEKE